MTLLRAYLTIASSFLHVRTVGVDESIDVLETLSPSPSVLVSRRLAIPPVPGDRPGTMLIEAVSVTERTLVATVAKIIPGQDISSRILIADTDTGPARWMQTRPLQVSLTDPELVRSHADYP